METSPLSAEMQRHLPALVLGAVAVDSVPAFEAWCRGPLRAFVPFGSLLCVAGRVQSGLVIVQGVHGLDWRRLDMARLRRPIPIAERQLVRRWLATRRPQVVADAAAAQRELAPIEWQEFQHHRLGNIAAHGVVTPDRAHATYFSFSHMPQPLAPDLATRLELAVPHLHQAICRVPVLAGNSLGPGAAGPSSHGLGDDAPALSAREWAIAGGLVRGLTLAELAAELGRSHNTVKHQLADLMAKLGTGNRAETVTRILSLGYGVLPLKAPGPQAGSTGT